jgi:3-methyladenine DNA glycosylase/8-oxoguanine DNA glycosylase
MIVHVPTPPGFSFGETIGAHGWRRLPPFVWHEGEQTLERVVEIAGGNVVRLLLHSRAEQVLVEVGGQADETEIACIVRRMLQLDVSLSEFHDYCRSRPELRSIAACGQGRMLRCPTLFEDVVKVIATTNTTWAQTIAMTTRLVEHFGADGHAFPTPERIAAVPLEEFAARAKMGYRSPYVYAIAVSIASGGLEMEQWQDGDLPASELRKRLLSLPGIGPYGAACLMLYLGKPEHVNADSWARMLLGKELGQPVTDKEVLAFFEQHGEWRGLVYNFYPWKETDR